MHRFDNISFTQGRSLEEISEELFWLDLYFAGELLEYIVDARTNTVYRNCWTYTPLDQVLSGFDVTYYPIDDLTAEDVLHDEYL